MTTATTDDADALTAIFLRARKTMAYLPSPRHSDEATLAWITGLLGQPNRVTLRATQNRVVVGFCIVGDEELEHLYVDPAHQNRRVGHRLLETVQASHDRLQLWVFQANTGAIRFYERHGFTQVERTDGARNEELVPDARYVWAR